MLRATATETHITGLVVNVGVLTFDGDDQLGDDREDLLAAPASQQVVNTLTI